MSEMNSKNKNIENEGSTMKKHLNIKVVGVIGIVVALVLISFGVNAVVNSSNEKATEKANTEKVTNRTPNEIEVKSNVAETPIVQPKEDPAE